MDKRKKIANGEKMSIWAYYDMITDKIYGAKQGTLSYYHEEGHRDWSKKGIEQLLQMWQYYLLMASVFLLTGKYNHEVSRFLMWIFMFLLVISESHAWIFAFNKYRKIKR